MAIPYKFIKIKLHEDAFVCSCGRQTYALFPGNKCSKCFDFEAERKKAVKRIRTKTPAQKEKMRYVSQVRYYTEKLDNGETLSTKQRRALQTARRKLKQKRKVAAQ